MQLTIEGISSIEAANAWLDTFIADFNRRFARPAKYPKDLHRPAAESSEELDDIFAWQELRKLSKTLTFRYDKMIYLCQLLVVSFGLGIFRDFDIKPRIQLQFYFLS